MIKLKEADLKDGMSVLLPSGFSATLTITDDSVVATYDESLEACYTKEEFKKLLDEGIFAEDLVDVKEIEQPLGTPIEDLDIPQQIADEVVDPVQEEEVTLTIIFDMLTQQQNKIDELTELVKNLTKNDEEDEEDDEDDSEEELDEDLNKTKQVVDQMTQQREDPKKIKNAITFLADDEKEAHEASMYAIDKMKESLLSTKRKSVLSNIILG